MAPAELAGLTLGDVPSSPELTRLRQRRADLGLLFSLYLAEDAP